MILRSLIYREQLRATWKQALAITIGVAVISAILISANGSWANFPAQVVYQMIVSTCVGSLFWTTGPLIRSYSRRLATAPLWAFRILCAAIILNLGVLIGLTVLASLGVMPWSLHWRVFSESVVPTTVIGLICFVAFTMYETLQYKAQYETTRARLSSLESRIRPHFLFNTLNSIMALIPEDPDAAEHMTERLATLLRYSLDATLQNTVSLEEELKVATDYLEIEKTRSGPRLQYSIDVPVELMSTPVPPFSLQTLVENSVKFGGGDIRIRAHNGKGRVLLQVWDSGAGFPHDRELPEGHGLQNLKDRLDVLWGAKAAVEFPRGESGTTVQVSLPASRPVTQ